MSYIVRVGIHSSVFFLGVVQRKTRAAHLSLCLGKSQIILVREHYLSSRERAFLKLHGYINIDRLEIRPPAGNTRILITM